MNTRYFCQNPISCMDNFGPSCFNRFWRFRAILIWRWFDALEFRVFLTFALLHNSDFGLCYLSDFELSGQIWFGASGAFVVWRFRSHLDFPLLCLMGSWNGNFAPAIRVVNRYDCSRIGILDYVWFVSVWWCVLSQFVITSQFVILVAICNNDRHNL